MTLTLADLRQSWEARDPDLAGQICRLAAAPVPEPETPPREGAYTAEEYFESIRLRKLRRLSEEEQQQQRREKLSLLESPQAEVPLPDKYRLHEIILELWEDHSPFARECLLAVIDQIPLNFGAWKALKRIFKDAEELNDAEVFAALTARFDQCFATNAHEPTKNTLGYLVRRAWRYYRRLGQNLPAAYPDAVAQLLSRYTLEGPFVLNTWVLNHVYYHETKKYAGAGFGLNYSSKPKSLIEKRAFPELWQRTPRPLFDLLERARSAHAREFAVEALKTDFRAVLRDVEPAWVSRLVNVRAEVIDEFVVWLLKNVPRFEQGSFRELGLHETALKLFNSNSRNAQNYAADYARTHARDLPVEELIRLANSTGKQVQQLVADLLQSRDARKEIGLDAWGRLLETVGANALAATALRKHFGASELTLEWFRQRLLAENNFAAEFARAQLPQLHPLKKIPPTYFAETLDRIKYDGASHHYIQQALRYLLDQLETYDPGDLPAEFLQRLFLNPYARSRAVQWVEAGKLKPEKLAVDFLKALAYHPDWETNQFIQNFKRTGPVWARNLPFDADLSAKTLEWMSDIRKFSASDLGFEWLLELVKRTEPRYHSFAVETMIKLFSPADFAPPSAKTETADATPDPNVEIKVDLQKQSFLFTGKLKSMQRNDAENKVKQAGGTVSSGVNAKLNYLVIGDEGSPLYGQGKKGSKQVKAEELREEGHDVKIISETAFLKMLAGEATSKDADQVQAGCEFLWNLAASPGPPDEPLRKFALRYLRLHHPEIALAVTDRPVDPGSEIPPAFLTFERVKPLFADPRAPLRQYAVELAKWELANWNPPAQGIIDLCEIAFPEVRKFVAQALLADDSPEHRRYRINTAVLTAADVYGFCESRDAGTRALGMELIRRNPAWQIPQELYRLSESPDRQVRAFVIRTLWSLYRSRGVTSNWKPTAPPLPQVGAATRRKTEERLKDLGPGVPAKPTEPPADIAELEEFLRRVLFEIPPGKLDGEPEGLADVQRQVSRIPARRAKLNLIETLRDLAVEDVVFARQFLPLLREFLHSRGQSEQAACLVAVTRIEHAYPELAT